MSIKLVTFADFHLGIKTHGTIDAKTGLNSREIDAIKSLNTMIDYCIDNNIKYILGAGDMFKNSLPSPTIQTELNKCMYRASKHGVSIYIMDGNHDVSPLETAKSALETYTTLGVDNIYHSRFKQIYYINNNLKLIVFPTYCDQQMAEQILDEEATEEIPTLVMLHGTIKGAMLNDWLIEQNEDSIDVTIFDRPNIIGVVLGHLHKYQILHQNPLVYYTGSLQRIDFTEEKQEKGFVVLDIDGYDIGYQFVEVPSQKFCTIKMDLTNSSNEMEELLDELKLKQHLIKNSIVRIILSLNKDNKIDDNIVMKELRKYNVMNIAAIQKNINRTELIRNAAINDNISEEQALEMYFKDHPKKDKIMSIGLQMINKLKDSGDI